MDESNRIPLFTEYKLLIAYSSYDRKNDLILWCLDNVWKNHFVALIG